MKFNKSEIMKSAWSMFKASQEIGGRFEGEFETFGEALKEAWSEAKKPSESFITADIAKAIKWAQSKNMNVEFSEEDAKAILEIQLSEYKTVFQAVSAVAKMNDHIQAA